MVARLRAASALHLAEPISVADHDHELRADGAVELP
jgi:hypothetical protein